MNARPSILLVVSLVLSAGASLAQPRPAPARDRASVVQPRPGTWGSTCVAQTGCVVPQRLPPCAPVVPADLVPLALAGDGSRVMVSGHMQVQAGCTEMECAPGVCCNHCSATVQFQTEGRTLSLGAPNDPTYACVGDDSGVCCGTSVPRAVVRVTGVLRHAHRRGASDYIENPALCFE